MTPLMLLGTAVVVVSLAVVVFVTLRNGSATRSVAHLLYDTEHPGQAPAPRPPDGRHP